MKNNPHAALCAQELKIASGELLVPLFNRIKVPLSEYSFSSVYCFRKSHHYRLLVEGSAYFLTGVTYDGSNYLMPLEDLREASTTYREKLLAKAAEYSMIFPVAEEWLPFFPEEQFDRCFSENDSDYLYCRQKLASYPGRTLHKKRNLDRQFRKLGESRMVEISEAHTDVLLTLLEMWLDRLPKELDAADYGPCREAISLRKELGLTGVLAFSGQEPVGFILGENLSEDVHVIHFAKANIVYKGVYQYLFSEYATHFSQGKLFNLEQDMGLPGLRKTKRSYLPDRMGRKYRVSFKKKSPSGSLS